MLTLQRASAGSGKTYTLTKRYLRLLISIKDEQSGIRRLRTRAELADSVQHILAVTFTNKATNEMKERILGKLNDLAFPLPDADLSKIDYLSDFMTEFSAKPEEIADVCREALVQILYSYSDFNISTIDAFFQTILRTFAYESDLPDAYQLIIDNTYLSSIAAKSVIDDMADGSLPAEVGAWVRELVMNNVNSGGNGWNIFQRAITETGARAKNLFAKICAMALELDKEEYKEVRRNLEEFFETHPDFRTLTMRLEDEMEGQGAMLFAAVRAAASRVVEAYSRLGADPALITSLGASAPIPWNEIIASGKNSAARLRKILAPTADPLEPVAWNLGEATGKGCFMKDFKKLLADRSGEVEDELRELHLAHAKWKEFIESPEATIWQLIRGGLTRMAIMRELRSRIALYLQENDAMQLADTNSILRRIISDDDVPFIYERIGTRVNHFLIDEFQDTSRLQWKNFYPLLAESVGKGNENLIIGDAKQSIYRFRNAEPKLITGIVPAAFNPEEIEERGFSENENANWRSRLHVVEFNNYLFHSLSRAIDAMNPDFGSESLAELYSNTVQLPKHDDDSGYVEMRFFASDKDLESSPEFQTFSGDDDSDEDGEGNAVSEAIMGEISRRIEDLLQRGYSQSDIAILVNRRQSGEEIIARLMDYNARRDPELESLKFVSEDSLRLGRSRAVQRVIECLGCILEGIQNKDDENGRKKRTPSEEDLRLESDLDAMLAEMQAVTLPSLVEAIVERFVDDELRAADTPFLAAFQDAVLDYCEHHPTDIGSLLRWWKRTGRTLPISSPEGTEAINVMTIHKSKGLEFQCVILPDINLDFSMRPEWVWLPLPATLSYAEELPKSVLVEVSKTRAEKITTYPEYNRKYAELQYLHCADQLNKAYVALTRAVSELYIYLPIPGTRDGSKISKIAGDILAEPEKYPGETYMEVPESLLTLDENKEEGLCGGSAYGRKVPDVAEERRKARLKSGSAKLLSRDINDYFVNSDREILKYHREGIAPHTDPADDDREDPRSEGSLLHAVLENVVEASDLDRAFQLLRARGRLTRADIRLYRPLLQKAIESVESRGWFAPGITVFNERPILESVPLMRRPDRLMLTPEGVGIVVDYKFGSSENISAHRRQVSDYMKKYLSTGIPKSVEGYIWYVREDKIVEVSPR